MGLRFTVLASGSTGNATVVSTDAASVLIDVGLSGKKIEELMTERDFAARELDAIFVTHEHSDHIRGLGAFARKHRLPIYANEKTWGAMMKSVGDIPEENRRILPTDSVMELADLRIESYAISHDAAEPVGYCFQSGGAKLSLATDLGYVSDKVMRQLQNSDVMVLESNHDVNMLRMGRYPWNTKRRILGDMGHLSNEAAGEALCSLLTGRLKRVYLAHLSQEHNLMDLAKLTVNTVLENNGFFFHKHEFSLCDTYYDRPTAWDIVG
ncbi:MBL fold metallo-hydrolase [Cohnella phaseoli]|uniref:Phosphoribosyl 1,2-cyclic phosphodiesterase n=1 Tax=Cohnella phaseoli TaxID=456490 RepID=A0A3D9KC24_9BACL|nr:MBL fold metallo-hydrolase [Cohnella phaseoli]RED83317.1 phosphoribosyl 1,2-cyclic phosphodiesterase [Cohnella phaseoli]